MPITTEKKVVARCDLEDCTAVRYGTDELPPVGFVATIEQITEDGDGVHGYELKLYACSMAHINKAAQQAFRDGLGGEQKSYPRIGVDEDRG